MKVGIIGLPNVGKSTLFNALTNSYAAEAANFPFCTIEPNVGIVDVKDPRVDTLAKLAKSARIVYATIKFVDIAGLVKGASKGEGLGNKFLANIREVDAIVHVVRYFTDSDVAHVEGSVNLLRDIETINTELIVADLEHIEKKINQLAPKLKGHDKNAQKEMDFLLLCKQKLEKGELLVDSINELSEEEKTYYKNYQFLTAKPHIYAINVGIQDLPHANDIKDYYQKILKKPICIVCAKLEHDMIGLTQEEKNVFLAEALHIPQENLSNIQDPPTLTTLIRTAFDQVGLMYFFTTGEKETRARTIKKNTTAPEAAGTIHTDFQKGFIKAEVVKYEDLVNVGSRAKAREQGKVRIEGKDYIVQDGDVMIFKFNV